MRGRRKNPGAMPKAGIRKKRTTIETGFVFSLPGPEAHGCEEERFALDTAYEKYKTPALLLAFMKCRLKGYILAATSDV